MDTIFTSIKLEDGFTMSSKNKNGERIKTFFHVPSFELYLIKVRF
jgi:hypothetical protein